MAIPPKKRIGQLPAASQVNENDLFLKTDTPTNDDQHATIGQLLDHAVRNGGNFKTLQAGNFDNRPAPGNAGHWFLALDQSILYFDDGNDWVTINLGGGEGFTNYVENGTFAVNIEGWEEVGGGTDGLSHNTVTPLFGPGSLNVESDGYGKTWRGNILSVDPAYLTDDNQQLFTFRFFARVNGAAKGDFIAYLFDWDLAAEVPGTRYELDPDRTQYDSLVALSKDTYEIRIEDVSANDTDSVDFGQFRFGPDPVGIGSAGGWKQYDISPSGLALITYSAALTVPTAKAVPYKDPITGVWRLRFNIVITASSATRTGNTFTISGVTFKAGTNNSQAVTASISLTSTIPHALVTPNTGTITVSHASVSTTFYAVSGDVELESKPTWADFDGTMQQVTNESLYANAKLLLLVSETTLANEENISPAGVTIVESEGIAWDAATFKATVLADGEYVLEIGHQATFGTATFSQLTWRLNGTAQADRRAVSAIFTTGRSDAVTRTLKLFKGDELYLRGRSNGTGTLLADQSYTYASITNISRFNHRKVTGVPIVSEFVGGIVPPNAGYIVETGSNSDGRWVKYSDGTMVCSKLDPNVGGYGTTGLKSRLWNFPQAFHSSLRPVSLVDNRENNASGTGIRVNHYMRTSDPQTNMTITFNVTTAYLTAPDLMFYATGRWKA